MKWAQIDRRQRDYLEWLARERGISFVEAEGYAYRSGQGWSGYVRPERAEVRYTDNVVQFRCRAELARPATSPASPAPEAA